MYAMQDKTTLIDGTKFSEKLRASIAAEVAAIKAKHGKAPGLAVVLVGADPASQVYVGKKKEQTVACGMNSFDHILPETTSEADLLKLIDKLNKDEGVNGILVQLPLPKHIAEEKIINAIDPDKDVDGFHVVNAGRLQTGGGGFVPCTPLGCSLLLKEYVGDISGKHAVVIGRSNIVGKPMAALLLRENCAVTVVHSKVPNIKDITRTADILVAAVGRPQMVKADWVKKGVVVIDVGINRIEANGKKRLVGDVDFDDVAPLASAITPVPGGVGPMTIACLLQNTLNAFKNKYKIT